MRQSKLDEMRSLLAILAMTITDSEEMPERAITEVRGQNKRILVHLPRIVRDVTLSGGECVLSDHIPLDEFRGQLSAILKRTSNLGRGLRC